MSLHEELVEGLVVALLALEPLDVQMALVDVSLQLRREAEADVAEVTLQSGRRVVSGDRVTLERRLGAEHFLTDVALEGSGLHVDGARASSKRRGSGSRTDTGRSGSVECSCERPSCGWTTFPSF